MHHPRYQGHPRLLSGSRHASALSQDTTVSGIADSTISNGESLRLSQFPQPPVAIPTTPTLSGFGTPSPSRSTFTVQTAPLIPQRKKLPVPVVPLGTNSNDISTTNATGIPGTSALPIYSHSTTSQDHTRTSSQLIMHSVSPYDWHDGASSIGMDATEDRLLSTSFITSLLQENPSKVGGHHISASSDALSNFSEMTYPPLASSYPDNYAHPSRLLSKRNLPHQPQSGRPLPPSSFSQVHQSTKRLSGDSDTLVYSAQDCGPSVIRTASVSRGLRIQGASPIGIAPAILHGVHTRQMIYHNPIDRPSPPPPGATVRLPKDNQPPQTRDSMHSTKSVAPSLASRISSHRSLRRVLTWRKVKPLPPVPLIPHIPITAEMEHRRTDESKPLPDLVNRAGTLQGLLEKGYHPHQSINTYYASHKDGLFSAFDDADTVPPDNSDTDASHLSRPLQGVVTHTHWRLLDGLVLKPNVLPKQRRTIIILGVFLLIALATVGTAIGLTVKRKKATSENCPDNFVGAACNLNSTCVCTSPSSGQCDGVAQNIIDLIPFLNQYFLANLTSSSVYNKIWLVQGTVPGSCASQSRLVDIALTDNSPAPLNITQWAQTAILWNLVESEDIKATETLQQFAKTAPWKSLGQLDDATFSTTVSGYTFNFATQEVNQPNISFVTAGQPTAIQLSQIGSIAHSALDRMYSVAEAASIQHQKALENYWTTVLQQKSGDLPRFISNLAVSPILLPFDATLSEEPQSVSELLTSSTSSPFPPPLGCYPGLKPTQIQQVNAVEVNIFGLHPTLDASQFDPNCYPDRPIYGVLDVLHLRLPFLDSRSGVPRQAAILMPDVAPRALLHSGAYLSPLPGPSNTTVITAEQSDPRQYGTLSQLNHVILQYLSSISDVNVATALVNYVLSSQTIPPSNTSILFQNLGMIPTLEVTIFGSIYPSDVDSVVSSFTTSSGSLFFGSDQGTALRNWAITGCGGAVVWAESGLSPLIVRDNDFSDKVFNETWTAASTDLRNDVGNAGLFNVTESFRVNQKFSPL